MSSGSAILPTGIRASDCSRIWGLSNEALSYRFWWIQERLSWHEYCTEQDPVPLQTSKLLRLLWLRHSLPCFSVRSGSVCSWYLQSSLVFDSSWHGKHIWWQEIFRWDSFPSPCSIPVFLYQKKALGRKNPGTIHQGINLAKPGEHIIQCCRNGIFFPDIYDIMPVILHRWWIGYIPSYYHRPLTV